MSYVYILNVQGTVEFIAPELISCKTATSSSDMWSDFYITYYITYYILYSYTILDYNIYILLQDFARSHSPKPITFQTVRILIVVNSVICRSAGVVAYMLLSGGVSPFYSGISYITFLSHWWEFFLSGGSIPFTHTYISHQVCVTVQSSEIYGMELQLFSAPSLKDGRTKSSQIVKF